VSNLLKNAFWVYGAILALAIREVLTGVAANFYAAIAAGLSIFTHTSGLEVFRAWVFLVLIVRYYLAIALYFEDVYADVNTAKFARKSYPIDFVSALLIFLVFFVASVTASHHDVFFGNLKAPVFLTVLVLIKLLGTLWWFAAKIGNFDTQALLKETRDYNHGCVLATIFAYFILVHGFKWEPVDAEILTLVFVLGFSGWDAVQVIARYEQSVKIAGGNP
jgi:hypothetical protein